MAAHMLLPTRKCPNADVANPYKCSSSSALPFFLQEPFFSSFITNSVFSLFFSLDFDLEERFEEKKALEENNDQCRLQQHIQNDLSVFFGEDYGQSDLSSAADSGGGGDDGGNDEVDDSDHHQVEDLGHESMKMRRVYWETQESFLEGIIERYDMIGSKLRGEVTRVIEMAGEANLCTCLKPKPSYNNCVDCFRKSVVSLLCEKGFNTTLRTSKWNPTHKFPGGMHEYIELIASTQGRKKQIPFIIELGFRDEFQMGKSCEEYHKLIHQLPEIYIGKPEYLNAIVRIVCEAAKKSAKEKKIHMGPWRKRGFVQMKWSGSYQDSPSNKLPLLLLSRKVNNEPASMIKSCFNMSASQVLVVTLTYQGSRNLPYREKKQEKKSRFLVDSSKSMFGLVSVQTFNFPNFLRFERSFQKFIPE